MFIKIRISHFIFVGILTGLFSLTNTNAPGGSMTVLRHLFCPVRIGRMTAKNRLLMSAMSINFGVDENNYVTDQLTGYLAAGPEVVLV
jgi:hypothetical protein